MLIHTDANALNVIDVAFASFLVLNFVGLTYTNNERKSIKKNFSNHLLITYTADRGAAMIHCIFPITDLV